MFIDPDQEFQHSLNTEYICMLSLLNMHLHSQNKPWTTNGTYKFFRNILILYLRFMLDFQNPPTSNVYTTCICWILSCVNW